MYSYIKCIGDSIYTTKIDGNKRTYEVDSHFKPYVYTLSTKNTGLKSYPDNKSVQRIDFNSIREFNDSIRSYPEDFIYGNLGNKLMEVQKIRKEKLNNKPNINNLNICFYDIEVYSTEGMPSPDNPKHMITSVTLKLKDTFYVFTVLSGYTPHMDNVKCKYYEKEKDMLEDIFYFISKSKIDVLSAWNNSGFDQPYMLNRATILGVDCKMASPFNKTRNIKLRPYKGTEYATKEIVGVLFLDLMVVYKKLVPGEKESFSLNNIAIEEVDDEKLDYSDEGHINDLMLTNPQKYIEYNIQDVELCYKINAKKQLIEAVFSMCYYVGADIESGMSNTTLWDIFLYNQLLDRNMVCPPKPKRVVSKKFIGAYVKEHERGLHTWGASFDLNSLYPHLIAQYNLSPDTKLNVSTLPNGIQELSKSLNSRKIEDVIDDIVNERIDFSECHKHNIIITPNGSCYKKDIRGLIPELMMNLYIQRKEHKNSSIDLRKKAENETDLNIKNKYLDESKSLDNLQYTEKIFLNSGYGAFTYKNFRYFDRDIAESITSTGQVSIKYVSDRLNNFVKTKTKSKTNCIVYNDTDSLYLTLQGFVNMISDRKPTTHQTINYLDKICSKVIEPEIDRLYDNLSNYVVVYENKMVMKREVIFESALWVAKKRYAMKIWDDEGVRYNEAKVKIKGMQIVRSDTPKLFRKLLKESVNDILNGKYINQVIKDVRKQIMNSTPDEIALSSGVNGYEKYNDGGFLEYMKGTPIHVKAVIFYNDMLKKLKVKTHNPYIRGDKIKYVFLKPNPYNIPLIGFTSNLPEEFCLDEYVFNEKHFEKLYMKVMNDLAEKSGIEIRDTIKLF